jgi:hypothetical protein
MFQPVTEEETDVLWSNFRAKASAVASSQFGVSDSNYDDDVLTSTSTLYQKWLSLLSEPFIKE